MSPKRQDDVSFEPVLRSQAMKRVDGVLKRVAGKDVVITLVGESGTGKEVLARRVHQLSRRPGPFVPINCAAIPDALFESELFGHERGAFTGAVERAPGKIESAHGGTLFLDEIGEMPLPLQAKMLRFLESRRFTRVGGTQKQEADVRIVCATLQPLEEQVRAERFRADLLYRINAIPVHVPPLRERRADLPHLVEHLVRHAAHRHGHRPPHLPRAVRRALFAYHWPGNVRELRNTLEMLVLLREGRTVRERDLPPHLTQSEERSVPPADALTLALDQPLDQMVRRILEAAVTAHGGNRTRAAERLGISTRTIQRHLGAERASRRARRSQAP